ncbi:MAG: T9SS type A sorting domain-containing protein, partial [Bacteroidota bacterium]
STQVSCVGMIVYLLNLEGCGTNDMGSFSTGFATQYSQVTATPASDVFCLDNIGAYDPNDKAALPVGYGEQHYIEPETELYYRIRFQNTGTDTAFTVIIRDTLSDLLDIRSLQPGNSTHDYELELTNERALTFTFNNILLPDSTTNLEASQGFVDFRISPFVDAPLESVIENSAAIYFDFNEPVITNTVFHTLGRDFLEVVNVTVLPNINISWEVYPNPVSNQLQLSLNGELPDRLLLSIIDPSGQQVIKHSFAGANSTLQLNSLTGGIYFLQLINLENGLLLVSAKLIKK